jgi:hypothetical protein
VTLAVIRLQSSLSIQLPFAAMLAFDSEVRRIFYRWHGYLDAGLRASGQILAGANVMTLLAHECDGPPSPGTGSATLHQRSILVRLLDNLERQVLMACMPDAGNRWVNRMALTGMAAPVAAEVSNISFRPRDRALHGRDEAELAIVSRVPWAIANKLDALALNAGRPEDART